MIASFVILLIDPVFFSGNILHQLMLLIHYQYQLQLSFRRGYYLYRLNGWGPHDEFPNGAGFTESGNTFAKHQGFAKGVPWWIWLWWWWVEIHFFVTKSHPNVWNRSLKDVISKLKRRCWVYSFSIFQRMLTHIVKEVGLEWLELETPIML